MAADFIIKIKVKGSDISWTKNVRLWSPLICLLSYASLMTYCCIIIKPANKLLEHKSD